MPASPGYTVAFSSRALRELQEIRDYIVAEGAPLAAQRHAAALFEAIATLERFPDRGRPAGRGVRELTVVPPQVIRYRVRGRVVEVIRIRHDARRPD